MYPLIPAVASLLFNLNLVNVLIQNDTFKVTFNPKSFSNLKF